MEALQYLPTPRRVWSALKVNRAEWLPKIWAEWPESVRNEWMRLAKVSTDYPVPPAWGQIPLQDKIAIMRVIRRVREMYVNSELGTVWHRIAWFTEGESNEQ